MALSGAKKNLLRKSINQKITTKKCKTHSKELVIMNPLNLDLRLNNHENYDYRIESTTNFYNFKKTAD